MNGASIIEGKDSIRAYGLLQIKHMLQMEVNNPKGPTWKIKPAHQARGILVEAGKPDPGRLKKNILVAYLAYLDELGLPV